MASIEKRAYTEIFNDKIVTYSYSKVARQDLDNSIYTFEKLYYDNLKDILNNEIIMCIGEICKYLRK